MLPHIALIEACEQGAGAATPEMAEAIATSGWYSYLYALKINNGRWEPGEAAIAKDPNYSFFYAKEVVKGRWVPGEAIMRTSPKIAYLYARYIIQGRWVPGEEAIAKDAAYSKDYSKMVLKTNKWYSKDPEFMSWVLTNC